MVGKPLALLFIAKASRGSVTAEDTAALALHLRLSNEQMKKLRLWTKQWNLHLASEGHTQRAGEHSMGNVTVSAELVQTVGEDGQCITKPSPFSWCNSATVLVLQHLEQLHHKVG